MFHEKHTFLSKLEKAKAVFIYTVSYCAVRHTLVNPSLQLSIW